MDEENEQWKDDHSSPLGDDSLEQRERRNDGQHPYAQDIPELVNPEWRGSRKSRGRSRKKVSPLSGSPQELQLWLQQGGWRYVAGAAILFIVALAVFLALNREPGRPAVVQSPQNKPTSSSREEPIPTTGGSTLKPLPTVTPLPEPTPTPAVRAYVVANTGTQGLFLRAEHATDAPVLATLPDGTRVEQVGEDFMGPGFVWRHVRAPDGQEGWVAADWLQAVP